MRRYALYMLTSAIFLCNAGCLKSTKIEATLNNAESLMDSLPDSALVLLSQINPDEINTKKQNAEYALLYSMALDKNYIFVKSDSLIRIARDFYRHSGDLRKRYLSNYYYGLVLHNRAENAEALVSYLEAEKDGLKLENSYFLGLLYNEISDLYKSQYDYVNSLKYARKSFEHYRKAGKNHHSAYVLYNMGDAYANLEQPDCAKRYFRSSMELFETHCDTVMIAYTLSPLALAHLADEEPQAAVTALWEIRRRWHTDWSDSEYAYMAMAYRAMNRLDSACFYLGQAAARTPSDPQSQAQLNSIAAPIHIDLGAYRQAAEEYRHYASVQDSLCRIALKQSYANLHRDYIEERQRAAEVALRAAHQRLWLIIALAAVSVLLVGYAAYINWRKRQWTKAHYLTAIEDIQRANQVLLSKLETRKESDAVKMRKLIKERFGIINELAATYYERQGANEQKAIFNKVKALLDAYASDKKGKQEIEEAVNAYYDDIMVKVRQELPALKESELDLLRYIYAGFSLRVISVFTGDSINYTAVKKSRLKAKIADSDASSKELFINSMT